MALTRLQATARGRAARLELKRPALGATRLVLTAVRMQAAARGFLQRLGDEGIIEEACKYVLAATVLHDGRPLAGYGLVRRVARARRASEAVVPAAAATATATTAAVASAAATAATMHEHDILSCLVLDSGPVPAPPTSMLRDAPGRL